MGEVQSDLRTHTRALYRLDTRGRIVANNQHSGGAVPRFHLARSATEVHWLVASQIDDELAAQVAALAVQEPVLSNRALVAAWARRVRQQDAVPLYSTSWDNLASQAVARSLGAHLLGADFWIR